ncbi:glycoside hydrolase family 32 protein [Sporolactobacillus pectinivorans]|uniref:glycoside hydrolase family 32 protein n=1 Tax=Sporolactobacillus pectinivorans TaxID=1591408 RepID=UPI001EFC6E2A|nr:glycoside hydrolase family 32 protein [Sporolactobacillus pectinivorans]
MTIAVVITFAMVATSFAMIGPANARSTTYMETYRPQFHFTPAQNWMNDPNGLVYYHGEYHLFFQYNPSGDTWGNMSWGHAVSRDLVHWTQLPVAIPQDAQEMIFSGCVVVDKNNTTGLGKKGNPAMVAIYTSVDKSTGKQSQALAYSTDNGRTFTKYSGNPVLDIGSDNFRDPKVFWYAPDHEWVMAVALSDQHEISFYSSPNLKNWTHLSDFGPAGDTAGVWECPDLFPLPNPNKHGQEKWVLLVNLNPGGIAGGSGAQYFIGEFNGKTFTSDDKPYTSPSGESLGNFDDGTFNNWTVTGNAFGSAPATGSLPGQTPVTGWSGQGFINSFNGGDGSTGNMTSPTFTIDKNYLNFQIGGGNNPYVPGSVPEGTIPNGTIFADFQGSTYGDGWTATGSFTNSGPTTESLPGQIGAKVLDTYTPDGDPGTGTITSPAFTIKNKYINLQIAGGNHPNDQLDPTAVNVIVDGQVVASATGTGSGSLTWKSLNVGSYIGKQAQIQIVDQNTGDTGWGHLMVGDIVFSDQQASPWATDTSVNLIVDGQVVRSSTGQNSENLDWTNWNVHDLIGKKAQIVISDNATGGWGHILADQFTLADAPALSSIQRAHWIDYGADDYAVSTYNNAPGGKRIMIGWMNNWNYGQSIPTSPWRSAMTIPKELTLRDVNGTLVLAQKPVQQLNELRGSASHLENLKINSGTTALPMKGEAYKLVATFKAGSAKSFGLNLRTGSDQKTTVGYDSTTGEVYIDRTGSGSVGFSSDFPSVQSAPLTVNHNGKVTFTILVDWSSVELFANDGTVLLTDQIFPDPSSNGMSAFSTGGATDLQSLTVNQLRSAWNVSSN